VLATDYGATAEHAADVAAAMALSCNAQLSLFHAVIRSTAPYSHFFGGLVPGAPSMMEQVLDDSRSLLEREAKRVRKHYPDVQTLLAVGDDPSSCILDAAARHGFDLIVIGTHGRRGVERFLLGSVAEKVVRSSPIAVLTVHQPIL